MTVTNRGSLGFHFGARRVACCAFLAVLLQGYVVSTANAWEFEGVEWYGPTSKFDTSGLVSFSFGSGSESASSFAGTQQVFFDFNSGTAGAEHVYTVAERDAIVAGVAAIYAPWDFTFSHTVVPSGTFATLVYNSGPAGGQASDIDFRNLLLGGSATIDVNPLLGVSPPSANVIGLSTTIGAHELGHLVGLRHADSLGPIGKGLSPTGPNPLSYNPDYTGPLLANETTVHTMASPASVGQPLANAIAGTRMGERSAVKLEFNEVGTVTPEVAGLHNIPALAQIMTLPTFAVPNTAISGDENFAKFLFADAEVITGSISLASQIDFYQFSGNAGDVINAEVISNVPSRIRSGGAIDAFLRMYRPDGVTLVPQGAGSAVSDDEFESLDSALIDIVLPVTGTYYVQVNAFSAADTGNYELYLYRFHAEVPEPGTALLLIVGSIGIAFCCRIAPTRI